MSKDDRSIELADDESNQLHATWSRSGKRLIVSVNPRGRWHEGAQVELDADQVDELKTFLADTSALRPSR